MSFSLKLLGGASLEGPEGPLSGSAVQRHRLALLALLATSLHEGVGREKLAAYLWPESDAERSRNSLKQAVHALRRVLGQEAILSAGGEVRLNPRVVASDVEAFQQAIAARDAAGAVSVYSGAFLDGFYLSHAPEFERWAESERERLHGAYAEMLETLAEEEEAAADPRGASRWWSRLAGEAPGNSRVALRLMQALAAAGDRAGAIRQGQLHAAFLREEIGAEPDGEVTALLERLRREPARPRDGAVTAGDAVALPLIRTAAQPEGAVGTRGPSTLPPVPSSGPEEAKPAEGDSLRGLRATALRLRRRVPWLALPAAGALALLLIVGPRWEARSAEAERSLAVLPFVDLNAEAEEAYFSDGMTEELIHALSNLPGLRVIARTSVFQFRGRSVDVRDAGRRLDVGMVLEGSVRKSADRLRITAQLLSTRDGSHLWSQTYDRHLDDVLAVQEEIARSIAGALRLRLTGAAPLVARHSDDREAYHLYLKGRHAINQIVPSAARQAIAYFEQAIARDSGYALAYVGLAHAHAGLVDLAGVAPGVALPPARAAALRALALDSTLAEAHALLGWLYTEGWQWRDAERAFERAFALDPAQPSMYLWYSLYLDNMGRFDEALAATLRAQELDPLSPAASYNVMGSYLHLARFEPAIAEARRLIELHPSLPLGYDALGWALVDAGRPAEAIEPLQKAVELGQGRWLALANLGRAYALVGRRADARAVLERLERGWGTLGFGNFAMAAVHLALGERERALQRLEQVYRLRHAKLPHVRQWTAFEPLYDDPDFQRIVYAAGYELNRPTR